MDEERFALDRKLLSTYEEFIQDPIQRALLEEEYEKLLAGIKTHKKPSATVTEGPSYNQEEK